MDAEQMQEMWDQLQIQQQLAKYCRAIDRCDRQLLKSVYWPEAYEDHGIFKGNAWEFADFIVPLIQGMRITMHQISNVLIELHGDHAAVETYVYAYHLADAEDGTQTDLVVGGRYLDKFERRDGEWRIAKRMFVLDWNQNLGATAIWHTGMHKEMDNRGRHDQDDLSYRLFYEQPNEG